ncbi:MAG: winged helix-turn-helix domain-containing protein [Sporolactobacillus sp.]
MDFQKYLECHFGYEEPILTEELRDKLNINPNTLRQNLKKAADRGIITRYALKTGIYYRPNPKPLFRSSLSLDSVIKKKYLVDSENQRIGYVTGLSFANDLGLTTQNALAYEIVTNKEKMSSRKVIYGKSSVFLMKPKILVTARNYKLLQIFDLISRFDDYNEGPLADSMGKCFDYLRDLNVSWEEIKRYLSAYSEHDQLAIYRSDLVYELASKQRAFQGSH